MSWIRSYGTKVNIDDVLAYNITMNVMSDNEEQDCR